MSTQPSRLKLLAALVQLLATKPLGQIKTRELIRTAGISKSTFYRQFEDQQAFLAWTSQYLLAQLSFQDGTWQGTPEKFYTHYFMAFARNRRAYKAFVIDDRWADFQVALLENGVKLYQALFAKLPRTRRPDVMVAQYLVAAHVGVAIQWLKTDDPRSPEVMAQLLTTLSGGALTACGLTFATLFPPV